MKDTRSNYQINNQKIIINNNIQNNVRINSKLDFKHANKRKEKESQYSKPKKELRNDNIIESINHKKEIK